MEDGMTDDVVHPCQSEDGASENSVSECNGITFPTEYLHTSKMSNGLTCTKTASMGLDEDWEENSNDTSFQMN